MRQIINFAVIAAFALLSAGRFWTPQAIAQQAGVRSGSNSQDGLTINKPSAYQGYSLVAPMHSTSTYLIDMEGRIVNEWKSEYTPAMGAYLLPNGHLLRPGAERGPGGPGMAGGRGPNRRGGGGPPGGGGPGPGGIGPGGAPGGGGRIQEFDWEGNLVWDFSFADTFKGSKLRPHHDICRLPNGNVLAVCSDPKTKEESIAAGRLPPIAPDQLLADAIVEIKPIGKTGGEIVWAWYAWDHLVQDVHKEKPNFGDVSEHPHRIDVNFATGMMDRLLQDPEQLAKLRSLGYVGGATQPRNAPPEGRDARPDGRGGGGFGFGGPGGGGDWMHVNSVAYNAKLDQIMISVHEFSEVWIIDHSTTTKEAASSSGGKSGKGGDLLYRWGNPKVYRNGTNVDQRLFAQHCAHWIDDGMPGAGNMLLFNNGVNRPTGTYSTVDEIEMPVGKDGSYAKEDFVAFGPIEAKWLYGSKENASFYSMVISGAQRLPNGNTFICSGTQGLLFEVTPAGEIVWQYKHPGAGFGGPGSFSAGGIVPDFLATMLGIDDAQRAKIKTLQDEIDAKLKAWLTEEQHAKLNSNGGFRGPGPGGFSPPRVGEVISEVKRNELKLTDDQSVKVASLQKDVTAKLNEILTAKQRDDIAETERMFASGLGGGRGGFGPPGGFGGAPRGDGRGADGPPPGFGGPPGFGARGGGPGGPGGQGGIFRSYRYGTDYPGLKDKKLTPGKKLIDVVATATSDGPPRNPPSLDGAPGSDANRN